MATVNREGVNVTDGAVHVALQSGGVIPSPTITGTLTLGDGTAATAAIATNLSGANDPGIDFGNAGINFTPDGSAPRQRFTAANFSLSSSQRFAWSSTTDATGSIDTGFARAAAGSIVYGGGTVAAGSVTSRAEGNKAVASIANAAATDILTVTIPNAAHSASLKVKVIGSLGAGGAIGANEASATNTYDIIITRTAGVATVVAISSAYGAAASAVAGAATVTATAAVTAMTGAVGATQTFTVQVTISRSGGSSTNHTCLVFYELLNANATGVTVA
jgi:hypothetical protein